LFDVFRPLYGFSVDLPACKKTRSLLIHSYDTEPDVSLKSNNLANKNGGCGDWKYCCSRVPAAPFLTDWCHALNLSLGIGV
jgi:hypothetical protein